MATGFWTAIVLALLPAGIFIMPAGAAESGVKDIAAASNAFALDLYARLRAKPEGKNDFFSPYSIAVALAMTKEGARGRTEAQMRQVLHLPQGAAGQGFAALSKDLMSGGQQGGYQMSVANSLWGNKGANIAKSA